MITIKHAPPKDFFLELYKPLADFDNLKRFIHLYGGRGGARSTAGAIFTILLFTLQKDRYGFMFREIKETILNSQYKTIKDVVNFKFPELAKYIKFYKDKGSCKIVFPNESFLISAFNGTNFKSHNNFSFVWYEEEPPKDEDIYNKLENTLRHPKLKVVSLCTMNTDLPAPFEEHYFYKRYFGEMAIKENVLNIHATYKDNPYNTPDFINLMESYKGYFYQRDVLGVFINRITGGNCYKLFNDTNVLRSIKYDNTKRIILSFDFNKNPHCSCLVMQKIDNINYAVDEIVTQYPNNYSSFLALSVKRYIQNNGGCTSIAITGDTYGGKNTIDEDITDYKIIMNTLKELNIEILYRVTNSNPSVERRIEYINMLFENKRYFVSDRCKKLIADLNNIKETPEGTKFKKKITDQITKQTYEEFGHLSDCSDYGIVYLNNNDFVNFRHAINKKK